MSQQHDMDTIGPNVTDQSQIEDVRAPKPGLTRRLFMARSALVAAAAAVVPSLMLGSRNAQAGIMVPAQIVSETISAALAFVVPGNDPYSVQQGHTHALPGGIEAYAALPLEYGLNLAGAVDAPFETLSELIAFLLNQVAPYVNPAPVGPFSAPFANLSFLEKTVVFSMIEGGALGPEAAALPGALITYAGLLSYSEAPVLDPATGQLAMTPVGWTISSYDGVSDGRKDFKGYYRGRRAATNG